MARPAAASAVPGPGVRDLATYGPALLRRDPVDVAVDLRERYGPLVRIPPVYPALDQPAFLATHPDDVRRMLQTDPNAFRGLEVPGREGFAAAVEGSILGPPGPGGMDWWVQRLRQIHPEFAGDRVATAAPGLARVASRTLAAFADEAARGRGGGSRSSDPAAPVDGGPGLRLSPLAARLAIRLLGESLFASDVETHEVTVIRSVARLRGAFKDHRLAILTGLLARRLPAPLDAAVARVRARRAPDWVEPDRDPLDALQAVAGSMVERRRRNPAGYDDAIAAWLTRPDPVTDETMAPTAVADEVTGMLLAGYATMGAALTWAGFLLATHPSVQAAIAEEARASSALAGPGAAGRPVYDDLLGELPTAHRAWLETLRLYPTLPVFGRMTDQPVTLSGHAIPADAPVLVSPYVTHRDPSLWSAPDRFDPDRFRASRSRGRPAFAYYPFSAGPHGCIGRYVATAEAVVTLSTLCRDYRVDVAVQRRRSRITANAATPSNTAMAPTRARTSVSNRRPAATIQTPPGSATISTCARWASIVVGSDWVNMGPSW